MLQWGRDVIVAEIYLATRGHGPGQCASMGPRRYRRGNGEVHGIDALLRIVASMGPRRYRRGNACERSPKRRAKRTLQWGRDVIVAEIVSPFISLARQDALQWGRDVIVAEMPRAQRFSFDVLPASMGPRRYRRGNETDTGGKHGATGLQWGRDVIVAEMNIFTDSRPRLHTCFNGAATLSSRKSVAFRPGLPGEYVLQWGRDVIVAEIRTYR